MTPHAVPAACADREPALRTRDLAVGYRTRRSGAPCSST